MTALITESGLYESMRAEDYHSDPCPTPSLSGSIAIPLINRSPRHAWFAHPRLNPDVVREESSRLDLGTVAHALLLGRGSEIEVINADDYKTKLAQSQRDAARAAGRTPVLPGQFERASAMAERARTMFDFGDGRPEVVMAWQEGDAWCRGMVDWLGSDLLTVLDYKTTSASARPEDAERTLYDMHYHVKAAFYERGLDVLAPAGIGRRTVLFLFQETEPPFECAIIRPSEGGMTIGRKMATFAIQRWQACLAANEWPGYGKGIYNAQIPQWSERRWLDREMTDPLCTGDTAPVRRAEPYTPRNTEIGD